MKNGNRIAAVVLFAVGATALAVGAPDVGRKLSHASKALDAQIASRDFHIDPAELLGLMHNNQLRLAILDVRDEGDFNLFHLIDARRFTFSAEDESWLASLPDQAVHVVVSNDEARADEAWKRLSVMGVKNVYILEGGMNLWLDLCKPHKSPDASRIAHRRRADADSLREEQLRYTFPAALGDLYPEARPSADCFSERQFASKVQVLKPVAMPAGGCGG